MNTPDYDQLKANFTTSAWIACLAMLLVATSPVVASTTSTLMLVGDVLPLNNKLIWRNLVKIANRKDGENLVISAANYRPKLYGEFSVRAFEQYGESAVLLPIAEVFQEFSTDYRIETQNPETATAIENASSVFFVGGSPHRLSDILFDKDGSPTKVANAIRKAHETGKLIVGGIPGSKIVVPANATKPLVEGRIDDAAIHQGLEIMKDGWYVDQYFFTTGRFAVALVAMHQFNMKYGIGVAPQTAAVVHGNQIEILGDQGVIVIDISEASISISKDGINMVGVRLSYLENGDVLNMDTLEVTPYGPKTQDFELTHIPILDSEKSNEVAVNMFESGNLLELMARMFDDMLYRQIGVVYDKEAKKGFQFRFYTDEKSKGWLSTTTGEERFTLLNVLVDIVPNQ